MSTSSKFYAGPPVFVEVPEIWEYCVPRQHKLSPYRYARLEPARPVVLPDADLAFERTTWANAWSYHRAATMRAELGVKGLRPTFVWMRDSAVAYNPYEPMPDVEGKDHLDYMDMHAPMDKGILYDLQAQGITIAKLNGNASISDTSRLSSLN